MWRSPLAHPWPEIWPFQMYNTSTKCHKVDFSPNLESKIYQIQPYGISVHIPGMVSDREELMVSKWPSGWTGLDVMVQSSTTTTPGGKSGTKDLSQPMLNIYKGWGCLNKNGITHKIWNYISPYLLNRCNESVTQSLTHSLLALHSLFSLHSTSANQLTKEPPDMLTAWAQGSNCRNVLV